MLKPCSKTQVVLRQNNYEQSPRRPTRPAADAALLFKTRVEIQRITSFEGRGDALQAAHMQFGDAAEGCSWGTGKRRTPSERRGLGPSGRVCTVAEIEVVSSCRGEKQDATGVGVEGPSRICRSTTPAGWRWNGPGRGERGEPSVALSCVSPSSPCDKATAPGREASLRRSETRRAASTCPAGWREPVGWERDAEAAQILE